MYTVIADAHLGAATQQAEKTLKAFISAEREAGQRIIWLGDTFDLLRHADAETSHPGYVDASDVFLVGNHDYELGQPSALRIGKTLLIHGDLVDFGYGFARLQRASATGRGTPLELLLARTRRWSINDVYTLYRCMIDLPDWVVSGLSAHSPSWRAALSAIPTLLRLWREPVKPSGVMTHPYDLELSGEGFGGYFTLDPKKVFRRVQEMYAEANADGVENVIMGHLHHQMHWSEGHLHLRVLGAWLGDSMPSAIRLDAAGNIVEEISIFAGGN